ncbi:hypothetical protein PBRA_009524 [Plasmodiophora brassicae]|uniref:Nucleotide-diphospho-sugar transferase domain-containing protein n=1 Tax=Plasmodiophora brassicae TaxID=37360 RepID=A0A0G4J916_PLABS|nr:hypothetical protein PBRA_009524 [Plasmodiophora brassicae]
MHVVAGRCRRRRRRARQTRNVRAVVVLVCAAGAAGALLLLWYTLDAAQKASRLAAFVSHRTAPAWPVLKAVHRLSRSVADAYQVAELGRAPRFSVDTSAWWVCEPVEVLDPTVWPTTMAPAELRTAVITITKLRRLRCALPIELWFLPDEVPGQSLVAHLATLGVTCRCTQELHEGLDVGVRFDRRRFQIKSIALAMSAFAEVVFLDSDNVPLADPTFLFDDVDAYARTGAVFWPDLWACNIHPIYWRILGLPDDTCKGRGTFESGQMLVDKRRHWQPVMLAMAMNLQPRLHYVLGTGGGVCGGGDKETFAAAFDALHHPYHKVGRQPGAAGRVRADGRWRQAAMVQYDPADTNRALFLHVNGDKFSPSSLLYGERRWALSDGRALTRRDDDIEAECLEIMVDFMCSDVYREHAPVFQTPDCRALRAALARF